jgi:hypothetical protein
MKEEQKLKRIPYGISNFTDFQIRNLYYVDKTRYIPIIEEKGYYLFFIRPRRFGKSLFLAILESYYDILKKDRFDSLFQGTYIHENPTPERNSYLILKLNFSVVDSDVSLVEGAFLTHIKNAANSFVTNYEKFLDIDIKEAKKEFDSKQSASEIMDTLLYYCLQKKQKLYIIIDEYDNFANTILTSAGEQAYLDITHGGGFYRSFFNVIKGGTTGSNAPVSRLFMTGVSPVTLDDVTSGFNIAENITLDDDLGEVLGFTRSEVETMIDYYRQSGLIPQSTPELMEMMSAWYNGYRFSEIPGQEVFNSTQVLYFIKQYMKDSKPPRELIDRNLRIDYHKLRHLIIVDRKGTPTTNGNFTKLKEVIENHTVHTSIKKGFSIDELTQPENFFSLLFYFGLLTIKGSTPTQKSILSIPNETVKQLYFDYIKAVYAEVHSFKLDMDKYSDLLDNMAIDGKWEPLMEYIAGRMESSLGLRDLMTGEKAVQTFLNVYLGLGDIFIIHSEKEMNKGFADLVMEPFLAKYPALGYSYVIEVKYLPHISQGEKLPREKILELQQKAGDQLKRYTIDEKFQKTIGKTKLIKLVLIFIGHRLVHMDEVK